MSNQTKDKDNKEENVKSHFLNKIKVSVDTRLWLIITTIVIIGFLVFLGIYWILKNHVWWFIFIFLLCIVLNSVSKKLKQKYPCKFLNIIDNICSAPFFILAIIINIARPFIIIIGTYLSIFLYAYGIPFIIIKILSYIGWIELNTETQYFIGLTFGSIVCSNSYKATTYIVKHSMIQDWGNHKYETYGEQLAIYLVHPNNTIFVLYLLYLLFLSISGYYQLEYKSPYISEEMDSAILKSFLVLIAFANMRTKAKDTKLESKELLRKTLKLFDHDD